MFLESDSDNYDYSDSEYEEEEDPNKKNISKGAKTPTLKRRKWRPREAEELETEPQKEYKSKN